jgi:hypothetical protein
MIEAMKREDSLMQQVLHLRAADATHWRSAYRWHRD